jgi:hypothetical protein
MVTAATSLSKPHGYILGDEMGLGKTSQICETLKRLLEIEMKKNTVSAKNQNQKQLPSSSLQKLNNLVDSFKYLIIAPKSVLSTWVNEIQMVSNDRAPWFAESLYVCHAKLDTLEETMQNQGFDINDPSSLPKILLVKPGMIRKSGWCYVEKIKDAELKKKKDLAREKKEAKEKLKIERARIRTELRLARAQAKSKAKIKSKSKSFASKNDENSSSSGGGGESDSDCSDNDFNQKGEGEGEREGKEEEKKNNKNKNKNTNISNLSILTSLRRSTRNKTPIATLSKNNSDSDSSDGDGEEEGKNKNTSKKRKREEKENISNISNINKNENKNNKYKKTKLNSNESDDDDESECRSSSSLSSDSDSSEAEYIPWFYQKIWDAVIIDEAHDVLASGVKMTKKEKMVENWATKLPHCVFHLKYKIGFPVTGTPLRNSISDLVSIAKFLLTPTIDPLKDLKTWSIKPRERLVNFAKKYLIRHTDKILNLPPLNKHIINSQMSELQKKNALTDMHTCLGLFKKLEVSQGIKKSEISMAILGMIARLRLNNTSPYLLKPRSVNKENDDSSDFDVNVKKRNTKVSVKVNSQRKKTMMTLDDSENDDNDNENNNDEEENKNKDEDDTDDNDNSITSRLRKSTKSQRKKDNDDNNNNNNSKTSKIKKRKTISKKEIIIPWAKIEPHIILANSPKLAQVVNFIKEKERLNEIRSKNNNEKCIQTLIFSFSVQTLELLQHLLTTKIKGYDKPILDSEPLIFCGETSVESRDMMVKLFQSGHERILLLSSKAGGLGITLTAATEVILLDPWWHPFAEFQNVKRAHRKGQTEPVNMYRLIMDQEESIDAWMLGMQKHKLEEASVAIPDFHRYSDCFIQNGNKLNLFEEFRLWIEQCCKKYDISTSELKMKVNKSSAKSSSASNVKKEKDKDQNNQEKEKEKEKVKSKLQQQKEEPPKTKTKVKEEAVVVQIPTLASSKFKLVNLNEVVVFKEDEWKCPICTLINKNSINVCDACGFTI